MNAASRETILGWLKQAEKQCAHHLLVVCDEYDWEDFPVYVSGEEDVGTLVGEWSRKEGHRLMEVYSLTGRHSIESQMEERRAHHLD